MPGGALVHAGASAIIARIMLPPIDYLIIGHITKDILPGGGHALGGTVAYSGLTASMFGVKVGAVTSTGPDLASSALGDLTIHRLVAPTSTTFINEYSPTGRSQRIKGHATALHFWDVPPEWRRPRWVHLGPVANEVDLGLADAFPDSFVGLTPQGWFRQWDQSGRVHATSWLTADHAISHADAVIISLEDVDGDEAAVRALADRCPVLVLTDGAHGARVYSRGTMRLVPAHPVLEVDPTGAGDIFAAAFFILFESTGDDLESARLAARLATLSVTRRGLDGIPSWAEVEAIQQMVHL